MHCELVSFVLEDLLDYFEMLSEYWPQTSKISHDKMLKLSGTEVRLMNLPHNNTATVA
jgi:hypothetical protein